MPSHPLPHRGRPDAWWKLIYRDFGKRVFDVALALLLGLMIAPIILGLWAATRADGGPGFFGHHRVGRDGRTFRCWKLRTMVVDAEERLSKHLSAHPEAAEEWNRNFKLRNDPRITPLGRFLRESSLDELPQLWNVLRGEMSFVGPRPVIEAELELYGSAAATCFSVRPGVTGLWQVSGRNDVDYASRVRLDLSYVSRISLARDLRIMASTVTAVLRRTGQ
jgi:lipopolysaccharide/colanic/teichoic acid biosynthesis glycosyltransferase